MVFFMAKVNMEKDALKHLQRVFDKKEEKKEDIVQLINQKLSEVSDEDSYVFFCTDIVKQTINIVAGFQIETLEKAEEKSVFETMVGNIIEVSFCVIYEEITVELFSKKLDGADRNGYLIERRHRITDALHMDYFENQQYSVKQEIIKERKMSYKTAKGQAEALMSANSMMNEIDCIYSEDNPKKFLGHPVHYKIRCSGSEAGYRMVELLVKCLLANGRLLGGRIDKITGIKECCYEEPDLTHLMENAIGNTVVIETRGDYDFKSSNFASSYENVVEFYDDLIRDHNRDVLYVLLEDVERPGFSKELTTKVMDYIDLVEIEEGKGDRAAAQKYMETLVAESEMAEYLYDARENIKYEKDEYTASELHNQFHKWRMECLRHRVYKSYANRKKTEIVKTSCKSKEKLDGLIGLETVKSLVEQIIAANVVEKRRMEATTKEFTMSRHMIFTGNPGSAKTTVARIIADTLREERVLKKGIFIECGRADLVGRYVGWTAKTVREQFRKANGGVLFIDEAYSLVDDSNSFGDEAINTIVQEMENYRENIIVIFAGYPDKMKSFLDKNEGLRSRIAFHVDFPDYGEDDLMKIFEKMMRDKDYRATAGAKKKVRELLSAGCQQPDFGNGRFVRNILEQSILKQSVRLYHHYIGQEIPCKELLLLKAADVELDAILPIEKKRKIGFCISDV